MKQILLCFLMFGVAAVMQPLYSQTNVSGTIEKDSTWTLAGSPYKITGSLTIASGSTLTIQPGVSVYFPAQYNGGLYLDVKGTLIAKGTSANKITFSGDGNTIDNGGYYHNWISGPICGIHQPKFNTSVCGFH